MRCDDTWWLSHHSLNSSITCEMYKQHSTYRILEVKFVYWPVCSYTSHNVKLHTCALWVKCTICPPIPIDQEYKRTISIMMLGFWCLHILETYLSIGKSTGLTIALHRMKQWLRASADGDGLIEDCSSEAVPWDQARLSPSRHSVSILEAPKVPNTSDLTCKCKVVYNLLNIYTQTYSQIHTWV